MAALPNLLAALFCLPLLAVTATPQLALQPIIKVGLQLEALGDRASLAQCLLPPVAAEALPDRVSARLAEAER